MENFVYVNSWETHEEFGNYLQVHSIMYDHRGIFDFEGMSQRRWTWMRSNSVKYESVPSGDPNFRPLSECKEVILPKSVIYAAETVLSCKNYLGSVDLLTLILEFEEESMNVSNGRPRMSLSPGYKKGFGNLLIAAQEGDKVRVGKWDLETNRKFDGGSDHFYLRGTNNRPFGSELSREICKMF